MKRQLPAVARVRRHAREHQKAVDEGHRLEVEERSTKENIYRGEAEKLIEEVNAEDRRGAGGGGSIGFS